MKKRILLTLPGLLGLQLAFGQVINTATMDSADYKVHGKVTVEGYVDAYYAYNFNEPAHGDQPYLVSMARHNEMNINLAFVDVKYSSSRVRARVVPGFGTYIDMNYSRETGPLKNLVEANAGIKLFSKKNIWLDVGVLGSPYTNESAISKDHLAYTRSLAAENVPYYLSGAKLTVPISQKITSYFFFINGWQQITDRNSNKSFGSQIEIRPNNNVLLSWNNYIGKESAAIDSVEGLRYFTDLYLLYSKDKVSLTSCVYYGQQENGDDMLGWWQANLVCRYNFTTTLSGSFRVEYFSDHEGALVLPVTTSKGFETFGASAGINIKIEDNILFRTEARQLISGQNVYSDHGTPAQSSMTLTASFCAWF